jgi:hypothetical protein
MITKVPEPAFYSRSDMNNENALRARFLAGLRLKYREQYIPGPGRGTSPWEAAEKSYGKRQRTAAAKQAAEKVGIRRSAPKEAFGFERFAVSLKRYADTKLEPFRSL